MSSHAADISRVSSGRWAVMLLEGKECVQRGLGSCSVSRRKGAGNPVGFPERVLLRDLRDFAVQAAALREATRQPLAALAVNQELAMGRAYRGPH